MAFELSFAPEFFYGCELDESEPGKPNNVAAALAALPAPLWDEACEAHGLDPEMTYVFDLLEKVKEVDTCTDIRSPVEVWVTYNGSVTVEVF